MVLRHFVRNWLRNEAQRRIRDEVLHAAKQGPADTAECPQQGPSDEPPPSSLVGVVFALGIESGGLEDLVGGTVTTRGHGFAVQQGRLKGRPLALVVSGAGRTGAARATEALIAGHRPRWVVSAGFAGGLSPDLKRHDVVVAEELVDADGHRTPIDLARGPGVPVGLSGVYVGRLLTIDRVVRLPQEKRSLFERHAALAVDMETLAVAEVCRRGQVDFLAVRVINDVADEELPPDVEHLLNQKTSTARLGAAVGAIWRRPSSFKDMARLRENALVASDRLAAFLATLVARLPS